MITDIVTIQLPPGTTREEALAKYEQSVPNIKRLLCV